MLKWEEIKHDHGFYLKRAMVFGGWLVASINDVAVTQTTQTTIFISSHESIHTGAIGSEWRTSITFVPDPNHEWVINQVNNI